MSVDEIAIDDQIPGYDDNYDDEDLQPEPSKTNAPLSEQTRALYEKQYSNFLEWCKKNNFKDHSEPAFIQYFTEKSKTCKSSTLWSFYSMLRITMKNHGNLDISTYKKLLAFLKKNSVGYKSESRAFSSDEVYKFLTEAPDETHLFLKVYCHT